MDRENPQSLTPCGVLMVGVAGFEPATFCSRSKRATKLRYTPKNGANKGTRTLDLRFTKPLLYRLSYIGTTALYIIAKDCFFVHTPSKIFP